MVNGLVMSMVSDALYSFKGKLIEVIIQDEDDLQALLMEADANGVTVKCRDDDDNDCLQYIPFDTILRLKLLTDSQPNPKKMDAGLEIEDSDDMKVRLQAREVDSIVSSSLGKGYEVEMDDDDSLSVSDPEGDTVIESTDDGLTVYDESAFEASKKIAVIMGVKKIIRDYQEE